MKKSKISADIKSVIKNAANKLSGAERREYIGEITIEFLDSNARKQKENLVGVEKVAIAISARATPNFEKWFGYAPCAINEGPIFTLKKGKKHSDCFKAIVDILNGTDYEQDTMRTKLEEFYEINDENEPCV